MIAATKDIPETARRPRRFSRFARNLSRRALITAAILLAALVAVRLALPYAIKWQINRRLGRIPDYAGHVDSVDVALWRGAYVLKNVRIAKKADFATTPFVAARTVDFSLAWRELFHGKVVADIVIDEGSLNFVKAPTPEQSQLETDSRWQDAIKDIFPINITRLEIKNGHLHYLDRTADPVVDVFVDHMRLVATGLRNRPGKKDGEMPAHLTVDGDSIGGGHLAVSAEGEPLADQMHFQLRLTLENVSLPALNRFLKAFGNVECKSGDFKLYMEVAARDGRFEGYAKPFFTGVELSSLEGKSVGQRIWQTLVAAMIEFLKNKPRDQLATRIPFTGEFGKTDVGFWATVLNLLRHGFVKALPTRLEHSVNADSIPPPGKPLSEPSRPPGS